MKNVCIFARVSMVYVVTSIEFGLCILYGSNIVFKTPRAWEKIWKLPQILNICDGIETPLETLSEKLSNNDWL